MKSRLAACELMSSGLLIAAPAPCGGQLPVGCFGGNHSNAGIIDISPYVANKDSVDPGEGSDDIVDLVPQKDLVDGQAGAFRSFLAGQRIFHDGKQVIRIILSGSKVLQGGLDKGIQNAFVGIGDRDHHAGKDHTYCQDEHTA